MNHELPPLSFALAWTTGICIVATAALVVTIRYMKYQQDRLDRVLQSLEDICRDIEDAQTIEQIRTAFEKALATEQAYRSRPR